MISKCIKCAAVQAVSAVGLAVSVGMMIPTPVALEAKPSQAPEPAAVNDCPEQDTDDIKSCIYSCALNPDLQAFVVQECCDYGIPPQVVFAMIETESGCNPAAIGDNGNSYGLMQVQARWHYERMISIGCTDLLDPEQNIIVGVNILVEQLNRYDGDIAAALTAYNQGSYNGTVSDYAQTVLEKAGEMNVLHR